MRIVVFLLAMTLAAFSASAQEIPPLFQSIQQGDEAAVKQQANKDTVNQLSTMGQTSANPLLMAVGTILEGRQDPASMQRIVDTLLDRGADPNIILSKENTQYTVVDLLVVFVEAAAREKKLSDSDAKTLKEFKSILAKLRKHGGKSDSKRVATLTAEIEGIRNGGE